VQQLDPASRYVLQRLGLKLLIFTAAPEHNRRQSPLQQVLSQSAWQS
jgi:hypothetical protein